MGNLKIESLSDLSVITITYNNSNEFVKTYQSLKKFRRQGGQHIIVNGGTSVQDLIDNDCMLIEEADNGIYDALNKGIAMIKSKFFMLIHSGDCLTINTLTLKKLLNKMDEDRLDIMLNSCTIDFLNVKRKMNSRKWKPFMLKLGVQPPHPPIIYRFQSVNILKYDQKHKIIADFKYLEELFKLKPRYTVSGEYIIHMGGGGVTSSGIKSFYDVTISFAKLKGLPYALFTSVTRFSLKLLMTI
jgi:putative colanic acid biosynthesis glycosyltransferase